MGTFKKEKNRRSREGKSSDGMANVKVKGENFYRSAKKVKTLNMYKDGKAQRNADGIITKAASYQSREVPQARIEPNRKWFTNTRVISQDNLTAFRDAMAEKAKDPYQVLLRSNKLPMSLLRDEKNINGLKEHQAKMTVESSPFSEVFGPKAQRKRVKIGAGNMEDLVGEAEKGLDTYLEKEEQARYLKGESNDGQATLALEPIFSKGGSKRIWNELYKVLDSSDVVLHVLDARDPLGTRCHSVEKYLRTEAPHKHLIFVLNKCDLVPSSVAAAWVRFLSKEHPCLAFHASITNSFGKGSLISLLRQFSTLHAKDRKEISVGMVGYPNVGKSSIINTLRKKKVCTVAPIPGETKVWQYISLMKRINIIDCPGIVPPNMNDTPEDILLRGVVRIENVEHPSHYIPALMAKVKKHHMERTYELRGWDEPIPFLEMLARKSGRLLKGGEPDVEGIAKLVVHDFLRGKIPWFTPCPSSSDAAGEPAVEGRLGKLGEMPMKRKRDDTESIATTLKEDGADDDDDDDEEDEFSGFDNDDDDESADEVDSAEDAADASKQLASEYKKADADVDTDDRISLGESSDDESGSEAEEDVESDEDELVDTPGSGVPVTVDEDKGGRSNKRRRTTGK